jgi:hypothetical protein
MKLRVTKSKLVSLVAALVFVAAGLPATAEELEFDETLTSGMFLIAPDAHSVDWAILNNSTEVETFRVTVYQYPIGLPRETVDQIMQTIDPGEVFHNANRVETVFTPGFYTEVVAEVTSPNLHPIVEQWSQPVGTTFIPGTLIATGDFVEIKKPKPPKPPKE